MASPRAVLWDLDGTLVDSEEYHWRAWQQTMAAEGLALTREQFAATFGRRNASFLPDWLPEDLAAEESIRRISEAKEECYRRLILAEGCPAVPGAAAWVQRLAQEGWLQAVASSAPRHNVDAVVAALGLGQYFQATVAAEDVPIGKPNPDVFLLTASRLAVPPSRCIVVEDAAVGIEAARRAGMRSIGIQHNGRSLPADLVVDSLTVLPPDAFWRLLTK
jgi:HAD superfamily hydrolase (TIGR01509 family)